MNEFTTPTIFGKSLFTGTRKQRLEAIQQTMKITLCQIQMACEAHAKAEAKKDLAFASGACIKGLSAEDQSIVLEALQAYAATGAARAIQFAKSQGWIVAE